MAAKKSKSSSKKKPQPKSIECKAQFASLGIGKSERIGVRIPRRGGPTPNRMDEIVTNSQLRCTMRIDPNAGQDEEGQEKLLDDAIEIEFTASSGGFRCGDNAYSFSLKMLAEDGEFDLLRRAVRCNGDLVMAKMKDAPDQMMGLLDED